MTILSILAAILMLGVLVMIHEAGHFFAARVTGIPVKEFSIGFGPKLVSWKSKKNDTAFSLRAVPAGGFCMFYGEDDPDADQKDPRALNNQNVWKRFFSVAMGPIMNFVLALVAATVLFCVIGEDTQGTVGRVFIDSVEEGSPAASAGFQAGDAILRINGQDASGMAENGQLRVQQRISEYREGDAPLVFTVQRGESQVECSAVPKYDEAEQRYLVGITMSYEYIPGYTRVTLPRAARLGADYCVRAGGAVLEGLKALVTTREGIQNSAGPVGIVRMIAEETRDYGLSAYVQMMILISVNLGLFNLLPIPGLDGSRLLFLLAEAVRGKPVNQKIEAYVHLAGYALLLALLVVITCRDVLNIFKR